MENKIKDSMYLFPGFSQDKVLYGDYSYINLWEEKYRKYDLNNAKYIIGHSMGSFPALLSWGENKDAVLILFNPIIPKRSYISIIIRFFKMIFFSTGTIRAIKGSTNLFYLPISIFNAIKFLKMDILKIIKRIPSDKLIIIRGEDDRYFCDSESVNILNNEKISFIELKNVGHYWIPEVDVYIKTLIK